MQLSWQEHPGQGPHLLLVHGFLSSHYQWQQNLEALSAVCRPVTVELWGHNQSPTPDETADFAPTAYVEQFEQIRQQLGCDKWLLCGYSLGAGLTIAYSLAHPERVLAHAFTNSTSALSDAEQQASWQASAEPSARSIIDDGVAAMERLPVHPIHAKVLPQPVKQALVAAAKKHNPLGIANTLRYTNPVVSVRGQIHANTRPVLLLWGKKERRFLKHQSFVAANMPHLQIAELNAGHGVNMEAHQAFNNAICDFIVKHGHQPNKHLK